jgi:hypothetical protein
MENGVHVVYHLEGQTGGSLRVSGLVSEQNGEEESISFLWLPHVYACRPGIVVKEKVVFHISVRTNSTDALS